MVNFTIISIFLPYIIIALVFFIMFRWIKKEIKRLVKAAKKKVGKVGKKVFKPKKIN